VVTAIAADDLESVPAAAGHTALYDADRLAAEARGDAMPGLTSRRDSHNITSLNAAMRITGMAPDADVLRTASRLSIGHDLRRFGAQPAPELPRRSSSMHIVITRIHPVCPKPAIKHSFTGQPGNLCPVPQQPVQMRRGNEGDRVEVFSRSAA
jgi:hypothetical protein